MAALPTHHKFHTIPVNRSGLRLREKYVLVLIFTAFLLLCFGTFFFVPDLRDRTYLEDAYKRFVGVGGDIFPIKAPKTPVVKVAEGRDLLNSLTLLFGSEKNVIVSLAFSANVFVLIIVRTEQLIIRTQFEIGQEWRNRPK